MSFDPEPKGLPDPIYLYMTDADPCAAAEALDDARLRDSMMFTPYLLSTAMRVLLCGASGKTMPDALEEFEFGGHTIDMAKVLKAMSNIDHPDAVFTRASTANFAWVLQHWMFQLLEFRHRFRRDHRHRGQVDAFCLFYTHFLGGIDVVQIPTETIETYRSYLRTAWIRDWTKGDRATWVRRSPPKWRSNI